MAEQKDIKIRRKPRPEQAPDNKENASTEKKKKRWKRRHKKPIVDLGKSLEELQAHINGKYHTL